jgi:hypothetical protein
MAAQHFFKKMESEIDSQMIKQTEKDLKKSKS